jgi:hypothetical protein
VLIDGGSSIDILFKNSLSALNISEADLKPYDAQFWGVLPRQSSTPLGQITLPVQFGTADHFRINYVNFVVTNFEGTYHAILGRPVITKFMVVPHYRYLVLKMPTEKGVLTLRGNVFVAYTCEEDSFRVAKAHDLSLCMAATMMEGKKTPPNQLEIPELEAPRKSIKSKEYKEIQLVEGDTSKMALIGSNLDPK